MPRKIEVEAGLPYITAAHQPWWSYGRWRSTTTSPVVMRSAISVVAKRPSGVSRPWDTKMKVSVSVVSKPPTSGRWAYTPSST